MTDFLNQDGTVVILAGILTHLYGEPQDDGTVVLQVPEAALAKVNPRSKVAASYCTETRCYKLRLIPPSE